MHISYYNALLYVFSCDHLQYRQQKKKGKKQTQQQKEEVKDGKKSVAAGKGTASGSTERIQKSQGGARPHDSDHPVKVGSSERPESHKTEISEIE